MVLITSLRIERKKMATQTITPTKGKELIGKCGVKIGTEVWQELEKFLNSYEENSNSEFSPNRVMFSDAEGNEYKERDYVNNFKKMIAAMTIIAREFNKEFTEYYIITRKPLEFSVGDEDGNIRSQPPTYTELLPFLFLGIARKAWTIDDSIYRIEKCTVQRLQA